MKKYPFAFLVVLIVGIAFPSILHANELTDNGLSLDSQRLEKDEERKLGNQSDLIASLFLPEIRKQLEANKELLLQKEEALSQELFTKKPIKIEDADIGDLFLGRESQLSLETKIDTEENLTQSGSMLPSILYGGLALALCTLAGLGTYLVNKGEE